MSTRHLLLLSVLLFAFFGKAQEQVYELRTYELGFLRMLMCCLTILKML